jgi:hypothetical protein
VPWRLKEQSPVAHPAMPKGVCTRCQSWRLRVSSRASITNAPSNKQPRVCLRPHYAHRTTAHFNTIQMFDGHLLNEGVSLSSRAQMNSIEQLTVADSGSLYRTNAKPLPTPVSLSRIKRTCGAQMAYDLETAAEWRKAVSLSFSHLCDVTGDGESRRDVLLCRLE